MNNWDNLIMKATSVVSTSCHFDEGILTKSGRVYLLHLNLAMSGCGGPKWVLMDLIKFVMPSLFDLGPWPLRMYHQFQSG